MEKILKGKSLNSAVHGTYTVTLKELKTILQGSATINSSQQQTETPRIESSQMAANEEGFREQRRRKRNNSSDNEVPQKVNKKPATNVDGPKQTKATRNFFAPLRREMEAEETENEEGQHSEGQQRPTGAGRPPPIVLTSSVNLIQLQKL
jgi:hypothetical protein